MDSVPTVRTRTEEDEKERARGRYREIISKLPVEKGWRIDIPLYLYQGFWHDAPGLEGVMWAQQHFKATEEDVLLISFPKCGTTWLKSLAFAIMNRYRLDFGANSHPFLTCSPHDLVPFLEYYLHQNIPFPDPDTISDPLLFHTHIPFTSLPQPLVDSRCRIVYISRNPKDVFISTFFFCPMGDPWLSIEDAFDEFCRGVSIFGPFWDHMLGYWKASLDSPERVLFLKYEDLKRDPSSQVKRLAELIGRPFSAEEEGEGLIDRIVELCSFENLRNLKPNKTGAINLGSASVPNDAFFRKGECGDWKNHLTGEMANGLDRIEQEKLEAYALTFTDSSH